MSEPEWVGLEDVPYTIADERWLNAQETSRDVLTPAVRIVDFTTFVATEEPSAEALLGTSAETLLPADGMLLMYGDGGAGKTTLTIDAVSHLASGESWLGIDVERPVKTLLIENEGPRGKFRQMLSEKHASWNGHPPFHPNVSVLEEPWTRFTMRDSGHREAVAETVMTGEVDLIVMGPLVTLGMVGGGTPDEISEFEGLLRTFRGLVDKPVALWIVHHENKQGDVSGAWERVPDTLCHVQARGNGLTHLVWRKARWSSENHGKGIDLMWMDGRSFSLVEQKVRDPYAEMLAAFRESDEWRTAKESGALIELREKEAKKVLAELVRRGEMVYEKGPSGRHGSAHCWRLKGALMDLAHLGAPSDVEPREGALGSQPLPYGEGGAGAGSKQEHPQAALRPGAPDDEDPGF